MNRFKHMIVYVLLFALALSAAGCASQKDAGYDSQKEELLAILEELAEYAGEAGLENKLQSVGVTGKLLSFLKKTDLSAGEIASISAAWLKERTPQQQEAIKAALQKALVAAGDMLQDGASQLLDMVGVDKEKLQKTIEEISAAFQ